jgi:hypothetical protein
MVLDVQANERDHTTPRVRLSVEMSSEVYEEIILKISVVSFDEILEQLKEQWKTSLRDAAAGNPDLPQELGAEVELRIVQQPGKFLIGVSSTEIQQVQRIPTRDELLAMSPDERSYWLEKASSLAEDLYRNDPELTITADATELYDYPDA